VEGEREEIYAEGHLLTGVGANVNAESSCPCVITGEVGSLRNESQVIRVSDEKVLNMALQNNTSRLISGAIMTCSSAGLLGQQYIAQLSGGTDQIAARVSHVAAGIYRAAYQTPRVGKYSLSVFGAEAGGLFAEYFNNRWLYDEPIMTRVDATVNFQWSEEENITPTGWDYVSVRWSGFVLPAFSETYTFHIVADDGARLFVGGDLLFDSFENRIQDGAPPITLQGSTALTGNTLTDIRLEWRESTGPASVRLMWSSSSQPLSVIPASNLFSASTSLHQSPFWVVPRATKPSPPTNLTLRSVGWDQLLAEWQAPKDDGGQDITKYLVEWWSAVDGAYGNKEVQSILFSTAARGGTWSLATAAGMKYPFALPWDATTSAVEEALEFLDTTGDVEVHNIPATLSNNSTRGYSITFHSRLGNIDALIADGSLLRGTSGAPGVLVCDDRLPFASTARGDLKCSRMHSSGGNSTISSGGQWQEAPLSRKSFSNASVYFFQIGSLEQNSDTSAGFKVRVSAANPSRGFGIPCANSQLKPTGVPDPPYIVHIAHIPASSHSLRVAWTSTTFPRNRASRVTEYLIEWSESANFSNALGAAGSGASRRPISAVASKRADHPVHGAFMQFDITSLVPGVPTFVRVSAVNAVGVGAARGATPLFLVPSSTPERISGDGGVTLSHIIADEAVSVLQSSTSLLVSIHESSNSHGSPVSEYLIEHFREPGRDEVQVIRVVAPGIIEGTFQVAFDEVNSEPLDHDVSEVFMEDALEALSTLRDVSVSRSSVLGNMTGYEWTITFLSEVPAAHGHKTVIINPDGLRAFEASPSSRSLSVAVLVSVGHNMQPGLPGWKLSAATHVVHGSREIALSTSEIGSVSAGDFVDLGGQVHEISEVNAAAGIVHLSNVYLGATATLAEAQVHFGVTVPGRVSVGLRTVHIPASLLATAAHSITYVLSDLVPGQPCFVRVSVANEHGFNQPQRSSPAYLGALVQAPDNPTNVQLIVSTGSSLKLLWNRPESDGGDTVTKYKVEWDTSPAFDSLDGGPRNSHHKILQNPSVDCIGSACAYVVQGLTKGASYCVRVFAYNSHGYSASAGVPEVACVSPKQAPEPPTALIAAPGTRGSSSIMVEFPRSAEDGSGSITKYLLEWDAIGQEAHEAGVAQAHESLLFSPHSIQLIETSCDTTTMRGAFRAALGYHMTPLMEHDISQQHLEAHLEALPTVGDVTVTRSTKNLATHGSYGFVWTVTFLTLRGNQGHIGGTDVLKVSIQELESPSEFSRFAAVAAVHNNAHHNTMLFCASCTVASIESKETVERYSGFPSQVISTFVRNENVTMSGTFVVQRNGQSTPPLPVNADAQTMEWALAALEGTGRVEVATSDFDCSGSHVGPTLTCRRSWTVIFTEKLGKQPPLAVDGTALRCSDLAPRTKCGITVFDKHRDGLLPRLDSALKGEMVLMGDILNGNDPVRFEITDLLQGEPYHVRVSAWNGVGNAYGSAQHSTPAAVLPSQSADSPVNVILTAASSTELRINWSPPPSLHGRSPTKYLIEWDGAAGVNEVQRVVIQSVHSSTAGSFRLSFRGHSTSALPHDASTKVMAAALEALQSVGRVSVDRGNSMPSPNENGGGWVWLVTFLNNVGDLPLLAIDVAGLRGKSVTGIITEATKGSDPLFNQGTIGIHSRPRGSAVVAAPAEVQAISMYAQAEDMGGHFYVIFGGERTARIAFDASEEDMTKALLGLATIEGVNVTKANRTVAVQAIDQVSPLLSDYGWEWVIKFTAQDGDLPSLLVQAGSTFPSTTAAGGTLRGTGAWVGVREITKGSISTSFLTPAEAFTTGWQYFARVSVHNDEGWSEPALAPFAVVPEDQVPGPPRDAKVSITSDSSLLVSWVAPLHSGGGNIQRYIVQWSDDEKFGDSAGMTSVVGEGLKSTAPGRVFTHQILGLDTGTASIVRVMASNSRGHSVPAFAEPLDAFAQVVEISISDWNNTSSSGSKFSIGVTMGQRTETTAAIDLGASARTLQDALHSLDGIGAVVVTRRGPTLGVGEPRPAQYQLNVLAYQLTFIARDGGGAIPSDLDVSLLR